MPLFFRKSFDRFLNSIFASQYRLPKATRNEKEKFNTPGAGYYEEQSPRIKKSSPRITIGLKTETDFEKLLRKEKRKQPGPGKYDAYRSSLSNISYTMGGKNDKDEIKQNMTTLMRSSIDSFNKMPGPADYNTLRGSFDHSLDNDITRVINTSHSSIASIGRQNTYRLPK